VVHFGHARLRAFCNDRGCCRQLRRKGRGAGQILSRMPQHPSDCVVGPRRANGATTSAIVRHVFPLSRRNGSACTQGQTVCPTGDPAAIGYEWDVNPTDRDVEETRLGCAVPGRGLLPDTTRMRRRSTPLRMHVQPDTATSGVRTAEHIDCLAQHRITPRNACSTDSPQAPSWNRHTLQCGRRTGPERYYTPLPGHIAGTSPTVPICFPLDA